MKIDPKKSYVIIDDFLQTIGENCCQYYRLSESTVQLALGALAELHWNSRWLVSDGQSLDRVDNGTFVQYYDEYIERAERELIMACDDALVTGFTELANAVRYYADQMAAKNNCCGNGSGSGGAGGVDSEPSPQTDTSADRTGPPPPGFETWSQYNTYKCQIARKILSDMVIDTNKWGLYTGLAVTATTLAPLLIGSLVTPVSAAALIVVALAMINVFVVGLSTAEMSGFFDENDDTLVCAMLNATSVSDAMADYITTAKALIEDDDTNFPTDLIKFAAGQWVESLTTVDSFNRLYEKVPYNVPAYPSCDCQSTLPIVWDFTLDEEGWEYNDVSDVTNKGEGMPWDATRLRIRVINPGVGASFVGEWSYTPQAGELIIPPGSKMVIAARGTTLCANEVRFGVVFVGSGDESLLISPYTYSGGSSQNETLNLSGSGEVSKVYFQFGQGTACTTAQTSTLFVNTVTLDSQ